MFERDAMGQPVVVEDLDPDWVLALLEDTRSAARVAERSKLRLAAHWCVLHPATADTGVATWAGDSLPGVLRLASCGFTAIQTAVAHAIAKYHPELLAQREKQGRAGWHVTLRHPAPGDFAGTSYLDVAGDTLDLTAFHDLVCEQAAQLKALGDTDDLEIRKAKALGLIATHQATLDLQALTGDDEPPVEPTPTAPVRRQTVLHAHTSLTDLLHLGLDDPDEVGGVEKLGPRRWRRSGTGSAAPRTWSSARCSTSTGVPRWTGTTRPRRSARSSSCATATASSPGAPSTRGPPTWTTSTPTSRSTRVGRRARPTPTTWPACAVDTTAPRPAAAGATDDDPTARTNGTAPTAAATSSPPLGTIEIHPN